MMQQSWSTADNDLNLLDPDTIPADGKTCVANPYPRPDAAGPGTRGATAAGDAGRGWLIGHMPSGPGRSAGRRTVALQADCARA